MPSRAPREARGIAGGEPGRIPHGVRRLDRYTLSSVRRSPSDITPRSHVMGKGNKVRKREVKKPKKDKKQGQQAPKK